MLKTRQTGQTAGFLIYLTSIELPHTPLKTGCSSDILRSRIISE